MPDATAPDGSEIYFLAVGDSAASLVEVVLGPGRTSRAVRHRSVREYWYFASGSGRLWLRSPDASTTETRLVAAHDVAVIPTGWDFQFQAAGDEALRFLCFTVPAWPGEDEAIPVPDGGLGEPNV